MNTFTWGKELQDGIYYFLIGQRSFFRERDLWKYALLPLLFMFLFYSVLIGGFFIFLYPHLASYLAGCDQTFLGKSLAHISRGLCCVICLLVVWATQSLLYQCFGAFIFDALSEYYEEKKYDYTCECSPQQRNRAAWESFGLSFRNFLIGAVLMLLSILSFGVGWIIYALLSGYLLGLSYFQACAVNHGIRVKALLSISHKHFLTITIFGTCTFLVQMLPFSAFLLTPGFFVGGCQFFRDNIYPEIMMDDPT